MSALKEELERQAGEHFNTIHPTPSVEKMVEVVVTEIAQVLNDRSDLFSHEYGTPGVVLRQLYKGDID